MTDSFNAVADVNAVAGSVVNAPDLYRRPDNIPTAPGNELGKDEFLQLLVAQLKYQDPLEPSSSEEFISTTAQFTVVEKLDELTKQGESSALVQSLTTASSLVGREITANMDGVLVDAVVDHSRIVGGQVVLDSDAGEISLNQIVSVGAVPSPTLAPTIDPAAASPVTPASSAQETPAVDSVEEAAVDTAAPIDEPVEAPDGTALEGGTETDGSGIPVGASPSDTQAVPVVPPVVDGPSAAPPIQPDDGVAPPIPTDQTDDEAVPGDTTIPPSEPVSTEPETPEPVASGPIDTEPETTEPAADPIDQGTVAPIDQGAAEPIPVTQEPTEPIPVTQEPTEPVTPDTQEAPPVLDPVDPQPVVAPADDAAEIQPDAADDQQTPLVDPVVADAIQALSDPAIAQAVQLLSNPAIADAVRVLSDPTVREALDTVTDADLNAIATLAANPLFAALADRRPETPTLTAAPPAAVPIADTGAEVTDPFDPFDPLG